MKQCYPVIKHYLTIGKSPPLQEALKFVISVKFGFLYVCRGGGRGVVVRGSFTIYINELLAIHSCSLWSVKGFFCYFATQGKKRFLKNTCKAVNSSLSNCLLPCYYTTSTYLLAVTSHPAHDFKTVSQEMHATTVSRDGRDFSLFRLLLQ